MVGILYVNISIPTINILYRPEQALYMVGTSNVHPILEMAMEVHTFKPLSMLRMDEERFHLCDSLVNVDVTMENHIFSQGNQL